VRDGRGDAQSVLGRKGRVVARPLLNVENIVFARLERIADLGRVVLQERCRLVVPQAGVCLVDSSLVGASIVFGRNGRGHARHVLAFESGLLAGHIAGQESLLGALRTAVELEGIVVALLAKEGSAIHFRSIRTNRAVSAVVRKSAVSAGFIGAIGAFVECARVGERKSGVDINFASAVADLAEVARVRALSDHCGKKRKAEERAGHHREVMYGRHRVHGSLKQV
jgi:hypothetical protein